MEDSGNRVMCYLTDGLGRAFVAEELMLIPEDRDASRLRSEVVISIPVG